MFEIADMIFEVFFDWVYLFFAFYLIIGLTWGAYEKVVVGKVIPRKRDTWITTISAIILSLSLLIASDYSWTVYIIGNVMILLAWVVTFLFLLSVVVKFNSIKLENKELKKHIQEVNDKYEAKVNEVVKWKNAVASYSTALEKKSKDVEKLKEDKDILETGIGYFSKQVKDKQDELKECEEDNGECNE